MTPRMRFAKDEIVRLEELNAASNAASNAARKELEKTNREEILDIRMFRKV